MLQQETTTVSSFRLVETDDASTPIVLAEPEYKIAVPFQEYYGTRLFRLIFDAQLALVAAALLYILYLKELSFDEYSIIPAACWLLVPIKLTRGLNWFDRSHDSQIVLDNSGAKLTFVDAFWRALVLVASLPLLPLNLCCMATGSRRLLHDFLSGTMVRPINEDPLTTFYPPAQKRWAIALVVACIVLVGCYAQCNVYLCSIEKAVAPALLGWNSKLLFRYFLLRDGLRVVPLYQEEASVRLVQSEERCRMAHDAFGDDDLETAAAYLYAARLASKAEDKGKCAYWIEQMKRMPQDTVAQAIQYESEEPEYLSPRPQQEYDRLMGVPNSEFYL